MTFEIVLATEIGRRREKTRMRGELVGGGSKNTTEIRDVNNKGGKSATQSVALQKMNKQLTKVRMTGIRKKW